ncbi:MAG: prepilin-type N-terminal cleavage/methylation domain-containing protein [Dehalococcoidia bacterium]
MKTAASLGPSHGLTFVELLAVIAILGIIACVLALNVANFFPSERQISQTASYTIYVVEEGTQKNIGMTVFGEVLIRYPRLMNIGDSRDVSLTFIPPSNFTTASNFTIEPTPEGIYYMVSDKCQFYSVMQAELNAVNFEISSTSTQCKEVSSTSETGWAWIISPNTEGEQLLRVELSTPVRVEGYEELVSRAVYSQQIQISVRKPFSGRTLLDYWHVIAITIGATVGAVFGVRKLWKMMKRKKTQNAKE